MGLEAISLGGVDNPRTSVPYDNPLDTQKHTQQGKQEL